MDLDQIAAAWAGPDGGVKPARTPAQYHEAGGRHEAARRRFLDTLLGDE